MVSLLGTIAIVCGIYFFRGHPALVAFLALLPVKMIYAGFVGYHTGTLDLVVEGMLWWACFWTLVLLLVYWWI